MGKTQDGNGLDLKRGPWTPEEDQKLLSYIEKNGHRNWSTLPQKAGLQRCGKSCRIRWNNYLRPDIKRGKFTPHEEQTIIQLHALLGNRWSLIAAFLTNRTDNEIKNYWNCRLKKRLAKMGIDPSTHRRNSHSIGLSNSEPKNAAKIIHMAQWESTRLEAEARLVRKPKLENRPLNSLESEILSNFRAMPHFYVNSFDQPHEEIVASKPALSPCLDILKAWEIVAGACASLDAENYNNKPQRSSSSSFLENAVTILPAMSESNLEGFPSGCIATDNLGAINAKIFDDSEDIWAVEPMDMGSQASFDDFWDLLPCNSTEGKLLNGEGFFIDDGRRAGEELLVCSLSYCGRLGSLLMH